MGALSRSAAVQAKLAELAALEEAEAEKLEAAQAEQAASEPAAPVVPPGHGQVAMFFSNTATGAVERSLMPVADAYRVEQLAGWSREPPAGLRVVDMAKRPGNANPNWPDGPQPEGAMRNVA